MAVSTGYITRLATGGGGSEEQWMNKIGVLELVGSGELSLLNSSAVSITDIVDWGRDEVAFSSVTETADFVVEGVRCWTQQHIVDFDEEENPIYSTETALVNLQLVVANEIAILKPSSIYLSFYGGAFYETYRSQSSYAILFICIRDENNEILCEFYEEKYSTDNSPWNHEIELFPEYPTYNSSEMKKIEIINYLSPNWS